MHLHTSLCVAQTCLEAYTAIGHAYVTVCGDAQGARGETKSCKAIESNWDSGHRIERTLQAKCSELTIVRTCSSHDKDDKQDKIITECNREADKLAVVGTKNCERPVHLMSFSCSCNVWLSPSPQNKYDNAYENHTNHIQN